MLILKRALFVNSDFYIEFLLNSQAQGVYGKKNNLSKHHGAGPPEARGPQRRGAPRGAGPPEARDPQRRGAPRGVGPPEARGPMQLHRLYQLKAGPGYIAVLIVTNKHLERTLLLLNSVYGRGLKQEAREGILSGWRCFLVILKQLTFRLGYLVY